MNSAACSFARNFRPSTRRTTGPAMPMDRARRSLGSRRGETPRHDLGFCPGTKKDHTDVVNNVDGRAEEDVQHSERRR